MTYPQSYRLDSAMGGFFIATTVTSPGLAAVVVLALAGRAVPPAHLASATTDESTVASPREPALAFTVQP